MEKLHLPILIEVDEDGLYIVSCPLFKGCHSWGKTIDEAMKNISEVIEMCLEETKSRISIPLSVSESWKSFKIKMQKLPPIESQELGALACSTRCLF